MNCPKCDKPNTRKDGIINGKQRYFCAPCNFHYTVSQRKQKPLSCKKIALALHAIGLSNRKIKSVLNVSDVSIMNWIKKYKEHPELFKEKGMDVTLLTRTDSKKVIKENSNLLIISIDKGLNKIYKIVK